MWKQLTTDDLKQILSEDEIDTLNTVSVDSKYTDIVQNAINLVANMFRGAFEAKGYEIDIRDYYVPASYHLPVLQYARYIAWTRFPNSPDIALDEARKKEVERLFKLLENPYIGTEAPDWEHSSKNPEHGRYGSAGSISLPFVRFDEQLYWWIHSKE